jgi:hypothetical protein
MEKIGHDIKVVWADVVKYLPLETALASLIFPGSAAAAGVLNSVGLIQQAVVAVEQKFAAAGVASGTGEQKLAQVLKMVTPSVMQLLASEKITVDQAEITNIVNAVVAVLNAQPAAA